MIYEPHDEHNKNRPCFTEQEVEICQHGPGPMKWAECREALEMASEHGGTIWEQCQCGGKDPRYPDWEEEQNEPKGGDVDKEPTVTKDGFRAFMSIMLRLLTASEEERAELIEYIDEELSDRVLNLSEAADLMGVGPSTLKNWIRGGSNIPRRAIGSKFYFSKRAILDYLAYTDAGDIAPGE